MKKMCFVQTAVRSAVCIPLIWGTLAGCAAENGGERGNLTRYADADVSYTAVFDGAGTAECMRTGGTTVLRMTSPERLCGLSVTYDGASCAVSAGEMSVLLSPELASGLTVLFDLLASPAEEAGIPSKSADGTQTILPFEAGSVILGADGFPAEAVFGGRSVLLGDFTIQ